MEIFYFFTEIEFICKGFPSHGALINENNVVDKVALIMEKMMEFRRREIKRLDLYNGKRDMSKITTVNLTKISVNIFYFKFFLFR